MNNTVDFMIPADAWRDVTADYQSEDDERLPDRSCLLATIYIGSEGGWRTGFHAEAFLVTYENLVYTGLREERIYHGISEERLNDLIAGWDGGDPDTVTIDGQEYLLCISPFA